MKLLCCILLGLIGGIMLIKPRAMWIIGDSWKVTAKADPTSLYLTLIRIVGCILVAGGIFAIFD